MSVARSGARDAKAKFELPTLQPAKLPKTPSIVDRGEVQPLRRRDLAAARPIARIERVLQVADAPFSSPDMFERADHRAHLTMKEGAGADSHFDRVAVEADLEGRKRAHRARR